MMGDFLLIYVKKQEHQNKGRFSLFELEVKSDVDISFPFIKEVSLDDNTKQNKDDKTKEEKKAKKMPEGRRQQGRITISSSKNIKKQNRSNVNKKPHNKA